MDLPPPSPQRNCARKGMVVWLTPPWTDALLRSHTRISLACSIQLDSGVPSCYSTLTSTYGLCPMPARLRLHSARIFYRTETRTREVRECAGYSFPPLRQPPK